MTFETGFFQIADGMDFRARFVVVKKDLIYSDALRTAKDSFCKFFVRNMIQYDGGALIGAKVVVDGSGDRNFKRAFCTYIKKTISADSVRKVTLKDSKNDALVQLADMTGVS